MGNKAINLREKFSTFTEQWSPKIVAQLNDYDILIAKVEGEFNWHDHPDTDEMFMVIEGEITIEMKEGDVTLGPGELYVVPKGKAHRPVAKGEAKIMLIEPQGVPNTGDPATAAHKELI
ncbi:cupin domain-containing protein [Maritalea mediterranea]|uniref:Cupin domain-containing protein n=1 Tax=Maritalea mediterranea TaxID=2909667 RepID=A0ABS9ECN9_9HYPH|nr:cupin domain-containing protein [Maritalea mediterranea]MCF4099939.1 cupin domain-containing protein [Maritalea mediterranea]